MCYLIRKRIVALFVVSALSVAVLSSCGKEPVSIDGNTVSIAESKCSITFDSLTEKTYEEVESVMADQPKALYSGNDEVSFWEVNFSHQGDHDWPVMRMAPNRGFIAIPELTYHCTGGYFISTGGVVKILGGNINNSHAYIVLEKDEVLTSCEFEYKGYSFSFDFQNSVWSYTESD
ncbi:MAG: hypothetical protein LBL83_03870 [Clostridiales bacterium]|jgi:hypothetical protein|nr:hypothetical protein [Clostridiales bacterium]